jgi:LAS superfamily LD-carboxypeptidase LdcB/poly-gamma-glutamate capsule biosynthesis protein CapA/YwtB (metallophosphatase superfamily)
MKNIKTILLATLTSVVFFSVFIFSINTIRDIKPNEQMALAVEATKTQIEEISIIENKITTLFFVGDIMLTRGIKSSVEKNFNGDYNKLFANLTQLKDADILFGNLEGDVSDTGNNVGSKYSFRMDPEVLPVLKNAGFDIVSFANNHVGDWNMTAFKDTLSRLDENGLLKTGAGVNKMDAENPTIIEKNGTRFGFLGFSDVGPDWIKAKIDSPGILLASDPNIGEIIQNAKKKCDVLIISFHFGDEYKLVHNARQEKLAHGAIDSGADMIIGHHPHVMEDIEEYNGKPIVYSLGNFIFDQYFSKDTMRGMFFSVKYDGKNLIEKSNKIITLNKQFQPEGIFSIEDIALKDKGEVKKIVTVFTCPKSNQKFDDMTLLNVGQTTALPDENYIPEFLTKLDSASSTADICLTAKAKDSFESMLKKAREDGVIIKASSGYRSYKSQENIFNTIVQSGQSDALTSVAKPGYSEHQLGTTVDVSGASIGYISAASNFDGTPEDKWLKENAYLYGFIQSYPKDKETITGYKYEPWHYRYVGTEKANEIIKNNQTISEYLTVN